jgi:hypothetical protein
MVQASAMAGNGGGSDASAENTMAQKDEGASEGNFNNDMDMYMSNVNSQLASGNPFQSTAYKTAQNLDTSGAMHSTNDAADQAMRGASLRTGMNANAIPGQEAENQQKGQMTMDAYDANRDTNNEDSWLKDQSDLTHDQLAGADAENSNVGTMAGQADTTSGQLIQKEENEDQMWAGLGESAIGAGGKVLAAGLAPAP